MNSQKNQYFLEKIVDFFKRDYNVPTKTFIWAKLLKRGAVFSEILLFSIFLFAIFSRSKPNPGKVSRKNW